MPRARAYLGENASIGDGSPAIPWFALARIAPVALLACALATGCGGQPPEAESLATTTSPIYGGVEDNDTHANGAVVALTIGDGSMVTLCSGSLIAPNVVLTARHCVSVELSTMVSCDQNGNSLIGDNFGADQPVASIHVFVGPQPTLSGTPSATATAIFHSSGNVLCNDDLALVVIDNPLTTVAPLRVRLSSGPTQGENIRAVGYGQNDQNAPIGTRFRRDNVPILAVGSTVSASQTPLGSKRVRSGGIDVRGRLGGASPRRNDGGYCRDRVARRGVHGRDRPRVHVARRAELRLSASFRSGGRGTDRRERPLDERWGDRRAAGPGPEASAAGETPSDAGVNRRSHYEGPVNLHAGQGNACSVSGTPGQAGSASDAHASRVRSDWAWRGLPAAAPEASFPVAGGRLPSSCYSRVRGLES